MTLLKTLKRKAEYVLFMQRVRLQNMRPGRNLGKRLRAEPGPSKNQQPLLHVFGRLKTWFDRERTWGVEVRPSHLRTRLLLHLEREVAYEEVLLEKGSANHRPKVLEAAKHRLSTMRDPHWIDKERAHWEKRTFWPSVGATFRQ